LTVQPMAAVPWPPRLLPAALLTLALCCGAAGQQGCQDVYKEAFRKSGGVAKPDQVGNLYHQWCTKNMHVSSSKSTNELCEPLVRKVAEKMRFVPAETEVTPELVCKSAQKIQEQFPEHAKAIEEQLKKEASSRSGAQALVREQGKKLQKALEKEVKDIIAVLGAQLSKDLGPRLRKKASETLGDEANASEMDTLVRTLTEAAQLQVRGMDTKLVQKIPEAVGTWAKDTLKAASTKFEL